LSAGPVPAVAPPLALPTNQHNGLAAHFYQGSHLTPRHIPIPRHLNPRRTPAPTISWGHSLHYTPVITHVLVQCLPTTITCPLLVSWRCQLRHLYTPHGGAFTLLTPLDHTCNDSLVAGRRHVVGLAPVLAGGPVQLPVLHGQENVVLQAEEHQGGTGDESAAWHW